MICTRCGKELAEWHFGDEHYCQECWEAYCDEQWWLYCSPFWREPGV